MRPLSGSAAAVRRPGRGRAGPWPRDRGAATRDGGWLAGGAQPQRPSPQARRGPPPPLPHPKPACPLPAAWPAGCICTCSSAPPTPYLPCPPPPPPTCRWSLQLRQSRIPMDHYDYPVGNHHAAAEVPKVRVRVRSRPRKPWDREPPLTNSVDLFCVLRSGQQTHIQAHRASKAQLPSIGPCATPAPRDAQCPAGESHASLRAPRTHTYIHAHTCAPAPAHAHAHTHARLPPLTCTCAQGKGIVPGPETGRPDLFDVVQHTCHAKPPGFTGGDLWLEARGKAKPEGPSERRGRKGLNEVIEQASNPYQVRVRRGHREVAQGQGRGRLWGAFGAFWALQCRGHQVGLLLRRTKARPRSRGVGAGSMTCCLLRAPLPPRPCLLPAPSLPTSHHQTRAYHRPAPTHDNTRAHTQTVYTPPPSPPCRTGGPLVTCGWRPGARRACRGRRPRAAATGSLRPSSR